MEEYLQDDIANETAYKDLLMYVSEILSYEENAPLNRWLRNSYDSVVKHTINVPTNWEEFYEISTVEVAMAFILFSCCYQNIKWNTVDSNSCIFILGNWTFQITLNEVMEKSVFYIFWLDEETNQRIAWILLESFKIRRCMNIIHENPELQKSSWTRNGMNLLQDTKSNVLESKKHTEAVNYLVLCLIAYKAIAEAIYDRLYM